MKIYPLEINEKCGKRLSNVLSSLAVQIMCLYGYRTIILAVIKIFKHCIITPSYQRFTKENNVNHCIVLTSWESILWELRKTTKYNIKTENKINEIHIINQSVLYLN
jgi:hypothetical protein